MAKKQTPLHKLMTGSELQTSEEMVDAIKEYKHLKKEAAKCERLHKRNTILRSAMKDVRDLALAMSEFGKLDSWNLVLTTTQRALAACKKS